MILKKNKSPRIQNKMASKLKNKMASKFLKRDVGFRLV